MAIEEPKPRASRLGRGLSSLLGEVEAIKPAQPAADSAAPNGAGNEPSGAEPLETKSVPNAAKDVLITDLRRNPAQPRRTFDPAALEELSNSIKEKGILQPILVRPDPNHAQAYQVVAGERRLRAAKMAGLERVPVVVRELDELELLEIGIVENVQRTDLNPIEEAEAYEQLVNRFGRTQETLAQHVGKSRAHIANTLRLLRLPDEARQLVRDGKVSAGHARAALAADDPVELVKLAAAQGLSVREVEALARGDKPTKTAKKSAASAAMDSGKDVDTEALEADISRKLGLEVDIRHAGDSGGELRIQYRNLEQLDDVCRRLTSK